MITIKNVTLRNFLSTGNVTQAVNLSKSDLTLIIGENLDLGGDSNRNGVGKTTLLQSICYALFGTPINNIRKDNLVNRTNGKGMLVTLEFNVNGTDYKIERGRKPNVLKFYVNNVQQKTTEDQQGENKETQIAIEKVLNMTPDMFRHIVALNTYSQPFLGLKTNEQREIIEQLLGITILSEKAESLKEMLRLSKDEIEREEFRIKAVDEANKRVKEQIDSLKRRQTLWNNKHDSDLNAMATEFENLSKVDIVFELEQHKKLKVYNELKVKKDNFDFLLSKQNSWREKQKEEIKNLNIELNELESIDFSIELQAHKDLVLYNKEVEAKKNYDSKILKLNKDIANEQKTIDKLTNEIELLNDHKCYACGQDFHDEQHQTVLSKKQNDLDISKNSFNQLTKELEGLTNNPIVVREKPKTHFKTESEAIKQSLQVENIKKQIKEKENEVDPYLEQLINFEMIELGDKPTTHYKTEREAIEHHSKISSLTAQLEQKINEKDPYYEQIIEMEQEAIQEIKFEKINELTKKIEHQKFMLDILTSKDSFVRKKIIDQNLNYLNNRLTYYLDKIGLPHSVVFKNDLSVEITELGREMDFYNLSRGEMNRLILSLSWAFRDVWENLYSPINVLFIDELLDNGTDGAGVENSLAILKDMTRRRQKSIWLVSHREELSSRVPNILKVVKENGFTHFSNSTDIE